jgi:hypothetical protein
MIVGRRSISNDIVAAQWGAKYHQFKAVHFMTL